MRHSIFTKNLMERLPSPLLPGLWRDLFDEAPGVIHRFNYFAEDWYALGERQGRQLRCCSLLVVLFIVLRRLSQQAHRSPRARGRRGGAIIFRAGQGGRLGRSAAGARRRRRGDAALWRARHARASLSAVGACGGRHSQGHRRLLCRLGADQSRVGAERARLAPGGALRHFGTANRTAADRRWRRCMPSTGR